MTREQMMNDVIRKVGMEHPWVVQFCSLCEQYEDTDWNNQILKLLYESAMAHNWEEE